MGTTHRNKNNHHGHGKSGGGGESRDTKALGNKELAQDGARERDEEDEDYPSAQEELASAPAFGPELPPEHAHQKSNERPASKLSGAKSIPNEIPQPHEHCYEYTTDDLKREICRLSDKCDDEYGKRKQAEEILQATQLENHRLNGICDDEYGKRKQAEKILQAAQLENHRLGKIEADFLKLQEERLQAVDRFQPEFDEKIKSKVDEIEMKMKTLVTFINKSPTRLGQEDWTAVLLPYTWFSPYDHALKRIDLFDKDIKKPLLKSMIWRFLQRKLFLEPLRCYGGDAGELAERAFYTFYPKPHRVPESVKWRTLTVERLEASKENQNNDEIHAMLLKELRMILDNLGYSIKESDIQEKTSQLFEKAIMLAKLFACQRAIFQFYDPLENQQHWRKESESDYCKNDDSEDEEGDDRDIAFIVTPALLKRGTGMGEGLEKGVFLCKASVRLAK